MGMFPICLFTTRITIFLLLFFVLVSFLTLSHSQPTPMTPTVPTMAECGPRLFALAPCAPYVQGQSPDPTQSCCDNLKQVYDTQRDCLCLFLNGTALASLPINSTLALQLPGLCSPQIDPSTCSPSGASEISQSPSSQDSSGNNPGTAPATGAPTVTIAPRPSTVRFGLGKSSAAYKLSTSEWVVSVAVMFLLLPKLI